MITFTQVGDGTPKDIEVVTDDHNAELAAMADAFEEHAPGVFQAERNLAEASRGEDGTLTFTIPGTEVGEVAEILDDYSGTVPLNDFMDECNAKALAEAEEAE